jgi:SpoVK/Ycf46/Vps4 family AAA+-type ATPase
VTEVADEVVLAGLDGALFQLDLRLRLAVDTLREEMAERARDPFRGLYISETDVDRLLERASAAEEAGQILAVPAAQTAPRLEHLASAAALTPFEQEALLICLAPEIDLRYERLYGYLQDDVTRRRPTVDLILRLLCPLAERLPAREALSPAGRLLREGLLTLSDEAAAHMPLLARPLRVDERVVEYLLGSDRPDPRIESICTLEDTQHPDAVALAPDVVDGLVRLLEGQRAGGHRANGLLGVDQAPLLYLHGGPGTAKLATARAAGQGSGRALLVLDVPALLAAGRAAALSQLPLAVREAWLQSAILVVDGFDGLLAEDGDAPAVRTLLRRLLAERPASLPVVLLGEPRWEPATWLTESNTVRLELPAPSPSARLNVWRTHLDGQIPPDAVAALAAQFRMEGASVRAVAAAARGRATWRGDGPASTDDFQAAARSVAAPPLEGLARRLEARYGWDDIVLPPDGQTQLRELCARARHQAIVLERWGYGNKHARRASLTALFAGQPGTGKTMAAEIVAGALGLDVYRIDLSAVVSKYIGETEKNLERIFRAADQGDAVLLFDEADAIFGKRSEVRDAHDRYANVETAYLLQRLEAYEGLAVLTTNLKGNIDEAFLRRLDCVMEFPMPEEPERLAIWQRALPPEAPRDADVDLAFLARKFKLAGGHIRNIALTAAFLAAADGSSIAMKHLVRGTRREYQKLGKLVAESDFERYYEFLKDT